MAHAGENFDRPTGSKPSRMTTVVSLISLSLLASAITSGSQADPTTQPDRQQATQVVAQLQAFAHPLNGVLPGNGDEDLAPFNGIIGKARIVALGEASHGTHEFFCLKQRLLEYLVEKKGFTVFALEAGWPEMLAVDRYIKTGEGDPRPALAGRGSWTINTQEMLDLVEWMRAYNKAPGRHPVLSFAGVDMQRFDNAAALAEDYLRKGKPSDLAAADTGYAAVRAFVRARDRSPQGADAKHSQMQVTLTARDYREALPSAATVVAYLDTHKASLVRATSATEFEQARQAAVVVTQSLRERAEGDATTDTGWRDSAMATNVRWLTTTAYPHQKVILWAHNGHVGDGPDSDAPSMGMLLRKVYDKSMRIIGFAFDHGEIRAVEMRHGDIQPGGARPLPVPPARPDSVEGFLRQASRPLYFLDLHAPPPDSALMLWLNTPQSIRQPGSVYDPTTPDSLEQPVRLAQSFDALVFVETSHASIALPPYRQEQPN